jgi:hypothetical protein
MSFIRRYFIAGISLLVFSTVVHAQVLVKASVDKDKILVGEPISLTLEVHTPLGQDVTWFVLDSLPHFEYVDKGKRDTTESVDGKKWVQQLTITSYDSGYWQVPSMSVQVAGKSYFTDTLGINVSYAATPADLSQDYHDIKEIEEVPDTSMNYIPWIIGAATLVAIGVIVYLFYKKKKPAVAMREVVKLGPYEEAMQALDALQKKGLQNDGEIKAYYTSLNDILRVYVRRKLKIASQEKTNEELIVELKKLRMHEEYFKELAGALRIADFVKFAKYLPEAADNEKNYTAIRSAITTLNNIA